MKCVFVFRFAFFINFGILRRVHQCWGSTQIWLSTPFWHVIPPVKNRAMSDLSRPMKAHLHGVLSSCLIEVVYTGFSAQTTFYRINTIVPLIWVLHSPDALLVQFVYIYCTKTDCLLCELIWICILGCQNGIVANASLKFLWGHSISCHK